MEKQSKKQKISVVVDLTELNESDAHIIIKSKNDQNMDVFPPLGFDNLYMTTTRNGHLNIYGYNSGEALYGPLVAKLLKTFSTLTIEEQANTSEIFTIMENGGVDRDSYLSSYFPSYYHQMSNDILKPLPDVIENLMGLAAYGKWISIKKCNAFTITRPMINIVYYHSWC